MDDAAAGASRPRACGICWAPSLSRVVQGAVCKILAAGEVKPHKLRYYLERRDEAFEAEWPKCFASTARLPSLNKARPRAMTWPSFPMTRSPASRQSAPPLPTCRRGLAGTRRPRAITNIDGTVHSACWPASTCAPAVHARVEERHRSCEFTELLKGLDAAYPGQTAIKLILDNHSAHLSKETKTWVDSQPEGRFTFVFTPKHGSWLNLVEGFFFKVARSMLRHIRVHLQGRTQKTHSRLSRRHQPRPRRPYLDIQNQQGIVIQVAS